MKHVIQQNKHFFFDLFLHFVHIFDELPPLIFSNFNAVLTDDVLLRSFIDIKVSSHQDYL